MRLIADGGSTKTSWCLINGNKEKYLFKTEGYNPYFCNTQYIINSMNNNIPQDFPLAQIAEVNYYGAGVHNEEKAKVIKDALQVLFKNAKIEVGHDLLAAARALLGNQRGFAAILGTGTNTCIYDGKEVELNIDSLGYILGDEGSGCFIGKKLLADFLRGYMPPAIREKFIATYQMKEHEILDRIYTRPLPNRFAASFSKFVYDVKDEGDYAYQLVFSAFDSFFKNIVSHYPNFKNYEFNCIGSVAYNFQNILVEVSDNYGMKMGKIISSPIDSLVDYHETII